MCLTPFVKCMLSKMRIKIIFSVLKMIQISVPQIFNNKIYLLKGIKLKIHNGWKPKRINLDKGTKIPRFCTRQDIFLSSTASPVAISPPHTHINHTVPSRMRENKPIILEFLLGVVGPMC